MEPNETTATIAKRRLSHRAVAVRRRNTPWVMRFCLLLAGEKSRNLVSQDCNEIAYMSSDPISLVTAPQQRHHAKLQAPRLTPEDDSHMVCLRYQWKSGSRSGMWAETKK